MADITYEQALRIARERGLVDDYGNPPSEFIEGPDGYMIDTEAVKASPEGAREQGVTREPFKGAVLPFSTDQYGRKSYFDPLNAGLGRNLYDMAKNLATISGDAYTGRMDPTSPEGFERALEAGFSVSPTSKFVPRISPLKPMGPYPGYQTRKTTPPTGESLKQMGKEQLQDYTSSNVQYSVPALKRVADEADVEFAKTGTINPYTAPQTYEKIKRIQSAPDNVGFDSPNVRGLVTELQGIRRIPDASDADKRAADAFIDRVYNFVERPNPEDIVSGPAVSAGRLHESGRGNYAAGKRSEVIGREVTSAERQAASANSGQNLGNALRQKARTVLENRRKNLGFNADELAAIEGVVMGTRGRNAMRDIGNNLKNAIYGASAGIGAGYLANPFLGLGVAGGLQAAGRGLKAGERALTRGALREADELIRSRSPAYRGMPQTERFGMSPLTRSAPYRVSGAIAAAENQSTPEMELLRMALERAAARKNMQPLEVLIDPTREEMEAAKRRGLR